jgi:hypothetical protein
MWCTPQETDPHNGGSGAGVDERRRRRIVALEGEGFVFGV